MSNRNNNARPAYNFEYYINMIRVGEMNTPLNPIQKRIVRRESEQYALNHYHNAYPVGIHALLSVRAVLQMDHIQNALEADAFLYDDQITDRESEDDDLFEGNGVRSSSGNWIEHVKAFSKKHQVSYKDSLKHPACRTTYHNGKG